MVKIDFPETGTYRLWVRTKDWVPSHHPGCFKVIIDGQEVPTTCGDHGQGWIWQDGGKIEIVKKRAKVALCDLTGFDGRCDALFFTTDMKFVPPTDSDEKMATWRRQLLRLPEVPSSAGEFDVVVVGGGIAGCSAALTAARLGLQVAFIQNRPVLGGNASTEIGITVRGQNRSVVNEEIRDHLLCAVYGTFATAKRLNPEKYANLELERVGHVPAGGESRRLTGDYILTEHDIRSGTVFPDAAALCSGHFCLHYPGNKKDGYMIRLAGIGDRRVAASSRENEDRCR